MTREVFRFQRFAVDDQFCGMKIGTDAVLLGAWADPTNCLNILDIGTGCGLIALMLAQRIEQTAASITAIDIDESASLQAAANATDSPWPDRIRVVHQALQEFATDENSQKFDLCVCNPPFFTDCSLSNDPKKVLARHTSSLSRNDLLRISCQLLKPSGKLALVLPYDQLDATVTAASTHCLFLTKRTFVRPFPEGPFKRVLIELSLRDGPLVGDELAIETKRNEFSPAYEKLTSRFHLRFAK